MDDPKTVFAIVVAVTLVLDGFLMAWLMWAFQSPRFAEHRIAEFQPMKVSAKDRLVTEGVMGALSLVVTVGLLYFLAPYTLTDEPTAWWVMALQGTAVFVLYDFAYYWMHRAMHHKKAMRFVHGVHHRVRFPRATESLYLSPIEMVAGLGLLMLTTWVVGPIHYYAFAPMFVIYSTLNILVHSGLELPWKIMAPVNFLARKHHLHHAGKFGNNYANLTPLPDKLFGTMV